MVGTALIIRTRDTLADVPFLTPMGSAMTSQFFGMKVMTGWTMIGTPAQPAEIGMKRTPTKSQPVVVAKTQNFTTNPQKSEKRLDKL